MSDSETQRHAFAAVVVGLVLGATSAAGITLLLYTGQGFLRAAGLLVSSTVMAVAAGLWASAPHATATRARWLAFTFALITAGITAGLWMTREDIRAVAAGGALAVLLVLALPAYTAGLLLAGLHGRTRDGGVASSGAAGAAVGVLLATTLLIQVLQPWGIYYGGAVLVSLTTLLARRTSDHHGDSGMHAHVTLITGVGSAGQLGYTIAQRFAAAGARVIVTSRAPDLQETAAGLAHGSSVDALPADLASDDDVQQLFDTIRARYGRLDSLINAAGGLSHIATVEHTTPEQWRHEIERNADTALRVCRAALPLLRASHGAIVNFTSPAGERAPAQLAAYSAAKAAVIALTRALALEEKPHGVRANAIAPGTMDTDANRMSLGDATFVSRSDVAEVAFFLATRGGRAINGETVRVLGDGLA